MLSTILRKIESQRDILGLSGFGRDITRRNLAREIFRGKFPNRKASYDLVELTWIFLKN